MAPPKFVDKIDIFMFTNHLSNTHSVSFKGMSKFAVNIAILSRKRYHVHYYLSRKRYLAAFSKYFLMSFIWKLGIFFLRFNAISSYSTIEKEMLL